MKKRSTIVVIILSVAFIVALLTFVRHRRDTAAREQRERSYEATLAAYAEQLRPGMTREDAHQYLRDHGVVYMTRRTGADTDDLVRIAREPSHRWYCSYLDVSVKVAYTHVAGLGSEPDADDRIKNVELEHWLQDCL